MTREIIELLMLEGTKCQPLETGGILLGWRDGEDRTVTGFIGPGPLALHGRHTFIPDHAWQIEQIHRVFEQSGGDLDYLGEWHTHPHGVAVMSLLDKKTLRKIARKVSEAIMVIGAGAESSWEIRGWMQSRRTGLFQPSIAVDCNIRPFDKPESWPSSVQLI